ncbi:hypothetical protein F4778DRAFT_755452 [Xylariomycetidae sp. FL2044]|nr:hypothetical protein F4778DRAFT_755452 [Xylariomycetidae sp. FL2044]
MWFVYVLVAPLCLSSRCFFEIFYTNIAHGVCLRITYLGSNRYNIYLFIFCPSFLFSPFASHRSYRA